MNRTAKNVIKVVGAVVSALLLMQSYTQHNNLAMAGWSIVLLYEILKIVEFNFSVGHSDDIPQVESAKNLNTDNEVAKEMKIYECQMKDKMAEDKYKREAKVESLRMAEATWPLTPAGKEFRSVRTSDYDLLGKAEEIYQWLTKYL